MILLSRSKRLALVLALSAASPALAQPQRGKVGGLGGISWPADPERDLPWVGTVGGFIGLRFNDNVSLETAFTFGRITREFLLDGQQVTETTPVTLERLALRRTDYGLDGTLVVNFGRRAQLHPYVLGGGGILRTDQIASLRPDAASIPTSTTSTVQYRPTVHFGGGLDIYFMYNVSARVEGRYSFPDFKTDLRYLRLLFGATYYF